MPPPPPAPCSEKYTLSATELFSFDSSELRLPQARLDEIASALGRYADVDDVVISGHPDSIGSSAYNQKLSERRAFAVKTYLASKGIVARRLKAQGKGEADPVVTCTDSQLSARIKCPDPSRQVAGGRWQ